MARCTLVVSYCFEYYSGGSTVWIDSIPILRENSLGGSGSQPPLFPFHQPHSEDLRLNGYLEYQHAEKALYIYKHPCLLRDSNPGPTVQQSPSLTTIWMGMG
ncbi:uncharacterized protein TNCV_1949831 [Trichonephila clavipes]|nr:uncharacterized protein TNCV_1949831 [Trichonephila clavipes]